MRRYLGYLFEGSQKVKLAQLCIRRQSFERQRLTEVRLDETKCFRYSSFIGSRGRRARLPRKSQFQYCRRKFIGKLLERHLIRTVNGPARLYDPWRQVGYGRNELSQEGGRELRAFKKLGLVIERQATITGSMLVPALEVLSGVAKN